MAELGNIALLLTLFLSSYAIVADCLGSWRKDTGIIKSGRNASAACFICLSVSVAALWILLLKDNFSVKYIAAHSSTDLPFLYKISALWAGAGGSLLLWLWLQVGFVVFAFCKWKDEQAIFTSHARSIANLVSVFFLLVLIMDKNPFAVSAVAPVDGLGLNPLLQHPNLIQFVPI